MSSILITCKNKAHATKHYVPALRLGGWKGEIALTTPGDRPVDLKRFSGLLLCGGGDIHPSQWDEFEDLHPSANVDLERDALEAPLIRLAWELRLPMFGVCRGEQMLNVALGGSLIQDIADYFNVPRESHQFGCAEDSQPRHEVGLDLDSQLHALLAIRTFSVNSRHHQAVKRLAPELKAAAWHSATSHPLTGPLIEAVEAIDSSRFALGVQWHPENLVERSDTTGKCALKLFQAFCNAASH